MKAKPRWIAKRALLLLHEESLAEFGGARGLRDEGLLESALARPQSGFRCLRTRENHPFADGNKRVAFLSSGMFLTINGYRLQADQVDAIQTMLAVASGQLNEEGLAAWSARNVVGEARRR